MNYVYARRPPVQKRVTQAKDACYDISLNSCLALLPGRTQHSTACFFWTALCAVLFHIHRTEAKSSLAVSLPFAYVSCASARTAGGKSRAILENIHTSILQGELRWLQRQPARYTSVPSRSRKSNSGRAWQPRIPRISSRIRLSQTSARADVTPVFLLSARNLAARQ